MGQRPELSDILHVLNATRTRATYGAVAGAINCSPRRLGRLLGRRRPEVSWVVNAGTGLPAGYRAHELHRELQSNPHVIADTQELVRFVDHYLVSASSDTGIQEAPPKMKNWQQFEKLIAEVYRKLGFRVVERGGAKADGGVDLELRKNGRRIVVQCKYWSNEMVGVSIVRELFGVMHHERADGAIVACSGRFTPEAEHFARENQIELIDGPGLRKLLLQTNVDVGKHLRIESQSRWQGRLLRAAAALALMIAIVGVGFSSFQYTGRWIVSRLTANHTLDRNHLPARSIAAPAAKRDQGSFQEHENVVRDPKVATHNPVAKSRFNQLYRTPPECIASARNPEPDLVECGNHRIRAYREFLQRTQ